MRTIFTLKSFRPSVISSDGFKVISLLYLPLLGTNAHGLYLVLYHLNNGHEYSVQQINDLLNFKNGDFKIAREKLEALGLLETYLTGSEYVFVLKQPFTAKQFLSDTLLGTYLSSAIGVNAVFLIGKEFEVKLPTLAGLSNISKSFDDVYDFKNSKIAKLDLNLASCDVAKLSMNTEFDFDALIELVSSRAKKEQFTNSNIRDTIIRIAYVYNYDIHDIVELYNLSLDKQGRVSVARLNLQASLYNKENNYQAPEVVFKEDSLLAYITKAKPINILKQFSKTDSLGVSLDTVNELLTRNTVDPTIVNVILITILKYKDGILPNALYLEKMLNSWLNKGITNGEEALNFVNKQEETYQSNKSVSYQKRNAKTSEPNWLNDFLKNLGEES